MRYKLAGVLAALSVFVASCSGSGSSFSPSLSKARVPSAQTSAATIFAANQTQPGTVTAYPGSANGSVPPTLTISLPQYVQAVATHNGYVYVTSYDANSSATSGTISVYGPGSQTPQRVITGPATGLIRPYGITVGADGSTYVAVESASASNGKIEVFSPNATGDDPPSRVIEGPRTLLANAQPQFVALDAQGNLYVSGLQHALLVFARGARGDAAPTAVISSPSGGPAPVGNPAGVAVDQSSGDIYVVGYSAPNAPSPAILVLSALSSGSPAVIGYLNASPYFGTPQGGWGPVGVALDPQSVYVTDLLNNAIEVIPKSASGDVTPTSVISGGVTGLNNPAGVALGS